MRKLWTAVPVVALLAMAPLTLACSNDTAKDPDYKARVNDQLKTANLDNKVSVDWKKADKELLLTGKVENAADKARAEELAQQVVGTSGRVVNEVKIDDVDYGKIDDQVEEKLNKMFEDRTEWDFDGRGVTFDSKEGVVTITGTVESMAVKDKIGARARATEGVKDVVNKLDVDAKTGPGKVKK